MNDSPHVPRALCAALLLVATVAPAQAQSATRGQLLYETHCIECHTEQVHWRTKRLARDWGTLREQVMNWQARAQLRWTEEDVDAVSGYLNDTIYRFERARAEAPPAHRLPGPVADRRR